MSVLLKLRHIRHVKSSATNWFCAVIRTQCRHCTDEAHGHVRLRFAPSPTGKLHLGGLRTALYNYLFARSQGGKFILRIEDTDQTRLVPGAAERQTEMLEWAGIYIDEGPHRDGGFGPYTQSQRLHLYQQYIKKLIENGTAYHCFCSPRRLDLLRKEAVRQGEVPKYDNRCRHLSVEEVDAKLQAKTPSVIRFKLEHYTEPWHDLVYGDIVSDVADIEGDPILLKTDGFPTYHFANVVDDHLMEITHILRGVEWQVSTTKHILLYKAFGWTPPKIGHLPLIMNSDGTKLSKRQGDIQVENFQEQGYIPEAMINLLTSAGSGFKVKDTVGMTMDQLIDNFDLSKMSTHSTRLDMNHLSHFNRIHLARLLSGGQRSHIIEKLKGQVRSKFKDRQSSGTSEQILDTEYIGSVVDWAVTNERISRLEDLTTKSLQFLWVFPSETNSKELQQLISVNPKHLLQETVNQLQTCDDDLFNKDDLSKILKKLSQTLDVKYSSYMKLLRTSLSGLKEGPSVAEMMSILRKDHTIIRLQHTVNLLQDT